MVEISGNVASRARNDMPTPVCQKAAELPFVERLGKKHFSSVRNRWKLTTWIELGDVHQEFLQLFLLTTVYTNVIGL
jgi:hypothetical protein